MGRNAIEDHASSMDDWMHELRQQILESRRPRVQYRRMSGLPAGDDSPINTDTCVTLLTTGQFLVALCDRLERIDGERRRGNANPRPRTNAIWQRVRTRIPQRSRQPRL